MERHGHLQLAQEVRTGLLAMSAATIDRALHDIRRHTGTAARRRAAPSAAIRRSVPVRTFDDWDDPAPWDLDRVLEGEEQPLARPLVGGHRQKIAAEIGDAALADLVAVAAGEHCGERALAGTVWPRDRVHLAAAGKCPGQTVFLEIEFRTRDEARLFERDFD